MKIIIKYFSKIILFIWGWKIHGELPNLLDNPKYVAIMAPHRKGFADVLLGWLIKNCFTTPQQKFFAKYELTRKPVIWWVLKKLGAIPVDRTGQFTDVGKGKYITGIVHLIEKQSTIAFAIAPEGTRTVGAKWRRGFYYIAIGARIPLVKIAVDYQNKRVIIGPSVHLKGGVYNDLRLIKSWYELQVPGYVPNIQESDFL